jgi:hypothetical protein
MKASILITLFLLKLNEKSFCHDSEEEDPKYSIGIVNYDVNDIFYKSTKHLLDEFNSTANIFNFVSLDMEQFDTENPIEVSLGICDHLISRASIYSIIEIGNPKKKSSPMPISYISAYYQIPLLSLYNREAIYSDQSVHNTFVRISPAYFYEANIWISLIKKFEWKSVNLIHSMEDEGKILGSKFLYLADQYEINVLHYIFIGSLLSLFNFDISRLRKKLNITR